MVPTIIKRERDDNKNYNKNNDKKLIALKQFNIKIKHNKISHIKVHKK
jgi:hypothetical protein